MRLRRGKTDESETIPASVPASEASAESSHERLGDVLIRNNLVGRDQFAEALLRQDATGKRLGQVLVESGSLDDETLAALLAEQVGLPLVDLAQIDAAEDAVECVPEIVARDLKVVPLRIHDGVLYVAVPDAMPMLRERLQDVAGMPVRLLIAPSSDISRIINRTYRALEGVSELASQFEQIRALRPAGIDTATTLADDAPVVRMLELILAQAARDRASDVHIEMIDTSVRLRFRIDGVMIDIRSLPLGVGTTITSRVKILAGLNIVERRRPQDGQFTTKVDDLVIDVRVAIAPTIWGEKVVLRLLDRSKPLFRLQQLGMSKGVEELYREQVRAPFGMVMCAGPTGSGKTTTLYASLMEIDRADRNVITIEDPVEYVLPSINQIQLNESAGVGFAEGLRAILRQDPDVILVGEIRDGETARIAARSALTGHLVLSSIHATDAASAVSRLLDMDVEPFIVTSALRAVVAQRLIRRICHDCKEPYTPTEDELAFYEASGGTGDRFYHGVGCTFCGRSGYRDRIGVYELLELHEDLRAMIVSGASRDEIRSHAINRHGMTTLRQEGLRLVDAGVTTIAEIARNIWAV